MKKKTAEIKGSASEEPMDSPSFSTRTKPATKPIKSKGKGKRKAFSRGK